MLLLLSRSPLAAMPRYVLSQGIVASLPVFSPKTQAINQKGSCGTRDPVGRFFRCIISSMTAMGMRMVTVMLMVLIVLIMMVMMTTMLVMMKLPFTV